MIDLRIETLVGKTMASGKGGRSGAGQCLKVGEARRPVGILLLQQRSDLDVMNASFVIGHPKA